MKHIKTYLLYFFLLSSVCTVPIVNSAELTPYRGDYRLSYDNLTLASDESMGLLGASYLLKSGEWYQGLGTYSAVSGERGGFFTIGYEFGRYFNFSKAWRVNASGFVGGGGGGAAPQGGGLMLRQSLSLEYLYGSNGFALGVSGVQFPNGDIRSEQLTLAISKRFDSLFTSPSYDLNQLDYDVINLLNVGKQVGLERYKFSAQLKYYDPSANSRMTTGQRHPGSMRLLGAKLQYFSTDNIYTGLSTYGANSGGVDGFAQLGLIAGAMWPLSSSFTGSFELQLGAAGGGRVETGGGAIIGGEVGISWLLGDALSIGFDAGYIHAPDGRFSARSYGLSAGYQYDVLGISKTSKPLLSSISFQRRDWRLRMSHQSYLSVDDANKGYAAGKDAARRIDLFGMLIDLFVSPRVYFSGQAIGAYNGEAGGYAVGLFGVGFLQPVSEAISLGAEMSLGSAGGGGLAVGSGLVSQYYMTCEYRFTETYSVELAAGRFSSLEGDFDVDLLQMSLNYRFSEIAAW